MPAEKRRDVTRDDSASSSVITLQLGLPGDSFAAQRKRYSRGDEELLRGREAAVYLRDRQQRDSDNGLIAEPSRRMLCSART